MTLISDFLIFLILIFTTAYIATLINFIDGIISCFEIKETNEGPFFYIEGKLK